MAKKRDTGKGKSKGSWSDPDADEAPSGMAALLAKSGLVSQADAAAAKVSGGSPDRDGTPADGALRAAGGKVVVRRERKGRGGKTVTVVSGLAADALEKTAKRMRKSLGCGSSVEGETIVLQGDQTDRAAAWLEGEGIKRVVRGS